MLIVIPNLYSTLTVYKENIEKREYFVFTSMTTLIAQY